MKLIAALFTIFIFLSCNIDIPTNAGSLRKISIEVEKTNKVTLIDLFKKSQFVPLEFTEESLIDIVEMLVYKNNRIYISSYLEAKENNELIIFDGKGEFLDHKYSNLDGPGSFFGVKDFIVTNTGNLEILDRSMREIIKFSKEGEYVENVKIKANASKFEKINGTYILYRGNSYAFDDLLESKYNLVYSGINGNIKKNAFVPISNILMDMGVQAGKVFFEHSGSSDFYFNDILNDTIYQVNEETVQPIFKLSFPDSSYKNKKIALALEAQQRQPPEEFTMTMLDFLNDPNIVKKVQLIMDVGMDLFLSFQYNAVRYFVKIDKGNYTTVVYCLDDPMLDNWFVFPFGDDRFVIVVNNPLSFKQKIAKKPSLMDGLPSEMKNYINNLESDVNPFLLVADPKELFFN